MTTLVGMGNQNIRHGGPEMLCYFDGQVNKAARSQLVLESESNDLTPRYIYNRQGVGDFFEPGGGIGVGIYKTGELRKIGITRRAICGMHNRQIWPKLEVDARPNNFVIRMRDDHHGPQNRPAHQDFENIFERHCELS